MRISCLHDDPGIHTIDFKGKILLDGEEVKNVITADEEEGYILVYARDPNGEIIINHSAGYAVKKALHGEVNIIPETDS